MNDVKNILQHRGLWLLLFALFMPLQSMWASHIVGGDITYRHVSGNTYEIALRVFRDCQNAAPGAVFDDPAAIGIFDTNDDLIMTLEIEYATDDTLDSQLNNPCLMIPPDVCVHTTSYKKTVILPTIPAGEFYRFVYQRCCRNQTINNIPDPEITGATYDITLTSEEMALNNSAPDFGNVAPIFICINESVDYDHSATDADGDELVYRFCDPINGATFEDPRPNPPAEPPYEPINFLPGFALDSLLGTSDSLLQINASTGFITGIPRIEGQFVVGICVDEYRNGTLLSTVRRDFEYNVGQCLDVTAIAEAPAAQCDNLTVQFTNNSLQADDFIWYFNYPNLNFSSTAENPAVSYPDTGTYTVRLIAEPDLECADTTDIEIYLQYNSTTAAFQTEIYDCGESSYITVTDQSTDLVSPIISWQWMLTYEQDTLISSEQNPLFEVPSNVTGLLSLTIESQNGCEQNSTQTIATGINNPAALIPPQYEICEGGSVELNPDFDSNLGWSYEWSPVNTLENADTPNPTASPLSTTTYSVTITAADNLCVLTDEVEVVVVPQPNLDFDFVVNCDGSNVQFFNQSTDVTDGYLWDFGNLQSNDDVSEEENPDYNYEALGTYTVTLSTQPDALCQGSITKTVEIVSRELVADFDFEYLNCDEEAITIQFTDVSTNALNNTTAWDWTFSNGATSDLQHPIITVEEEMELTAILTITTDEDCTSYVERTINVDFVDVTLAEEILVCQGDSAELYPTANLNYDYTWSPTTGLDDPTSPNPTVTPTETTIYTVFITSFGVDTCEVSRQITVSVPPVINVMANDLQTCDAEATIIATVQQPISDVAWTDSNGTVIADELALTVPVSGAATYEVMVTDQFGCSEQASAIISGGTVDIAASENIVQCTDEEATISVTNLDPNDDLSYAWSPLENISSGENTDSPTISNEAGSYTYVVNAESQFGCEGNDTVSVVLVNENATFSFEPTFECNGATVNFTNTSQFAFDYVWNFGDPTTDEDISFEDNPTYTYPEPGTYEVALTTIYDVDCVDTVYQTIEIPDELLIADFDFTYGDCETEQITIQFTDQTQNFLDNTVAWDWSFSNGTTSDEQHPTITLTEESTLQVELTVTTAENCTSTTTQEIVVTFIDINIDNNPTLCAGETLTLNPGGSSDYIYLWSPNQDIDDVTAASPTVSPATSTVYTVTITNSTGAASCEIVREVSVFVPTSISLEIIDDYVTCGTEVELTATTATDVTVQWSDSNNNSYDEESISVLPDTALTYYVEVLDEYGCTESDSVTITNGNMEVALDNELFSCPTDNLLLEAVAPDDGDMPVWQWVAGAGGTIISGEDSATPLVTVTPGTPVDFTLTAINQFDCSTEATISVTISDFMPIWQDEVAICAGIPTPLNPDANPEYQYTWSPATGLNNASAPNPIATLTENQTYMLTIVDTQGASICSAEANVNVTVSPPIEVTTTGDAVFCETTTTTISANAPTATEYVWSDTPDFSNVIGNTADISVTPEGSVMYYVQAIDAAGCTDSGTVNVESFPLQVDLDEEAVLCYGDIGELNIENNAADQSLTYEWSPLSDIVSGGNTGSPEVNALTTTWFYVTVENQVGCTQVDSILLQVEDVSSGLSAEATPDTIVFGTGETAQLTTVDNEMYNYRWTPNGSLDLENIYNPIASPEETTEYTVMVTGELGCTAAASVTVVVLNPECTDPFVFVPSAFTPNNDNENDVFYVRGNNLDEVYLAVYNRWGQKLFDTDDKNVGWDGTFKGEILPPDVYGYYLEARCFNGETYFYKGNVTLLR